MDKSPSPLLLACLMKVSDVIVDMGLAVLYGPLTLVPFDDIFTRKVSSKHIQQLVAFTGPLELSYESD